MNDLPLVQALLPAVRAAARHIEAIKREGIASRFKEDRSPVTQADEAAEKILTQALQALTPDIPIIGEEAYAANPQTLSGAECRFWLLDPIDGTKEFIRGGADYTINIGLIADGAPQLGVVMAPATGDIWWGVVGMGAWHQKGGQAEPHAIKAHSLQAGAAVRVLLSHRHREAKTGAYLAKIPNATLSARSSSIKFCLLAQAQADFYPRFGDTCEWDTAAGHAVLSAAGGSVLCPNTLTPLRYGKADFKNGPFLALGDQAGCQALGLLTLE
jgi:3'(2'), 5'-bisphosphate nucleotidase